MPCCKHWLCSSLHGSKCRKSRVKAQQAHDRCHKIDQNGVDHTRGCEVVGGWGRVGSHSSLVVRRATLLSTYLSIQQNIMYCTAVYCIICSWNCSDSDSNLHPLTHISARILVILTWARTPTHVCTILLNLNLHLLATCSNQHNFTWRVLKTELITAAFGYCHVMRIAHQ
jgi:hypothetical protein